MFVNPLIDTATFNEETLWTKIGDLQKRINLAHMNGNMQMVGQFQALLEMYTEELSNRHFAQKEDKDPALRKSGVIYESDPELAEQQGLGNKDQKTTKKPWRAS